MPTSQQYTTAWLDTSSSHPSEIFFQAPEPLIEELCNSTKLEKSDEDPNSKTSQTSSGVRQREKESGNLFNTVLDYSLYLYTYRWEEMGIHLWNIPYIPNGYTNRKQGSSFSSRG